MAKNKIGVTVKGELKRTWKFINFLNTDWYAKILQKYADEGLSQLINATPVDTGITANSWSYTIDITKKRTIIEYSNDSVTSSGTPVVILLQYGHATKSGGFVEGVDFINPALTPVFERLSADLWEEVVRA